MSQSAYKAFQDKAIGPVNRRDFDHMFDATVQEEINGPKALDRLLDWYDTGMDYSCDDLPSFIASHRIGCVWAVLLRKHHSKS